MYIKDGAARLADYDECDTLVVMDRARAISSLQAARLTSIGRCDGPTR